MLSANRVRACVVMKGYLILVHGAAPSLAEDRSIDGSGNNVANPAWGMSFTVQRRAAPAAYADGVSAPAGADRPNARAISNAIADQYGESMPNSVRISDWAWQWGQFVDHDLTLSEFMVPEEPFDIDVPMGDPMFDAQRSGTQRILLSRSVYDPLTGTDSDNPRQQINQLTAFLDGSGVYGSDEQRAAWLRTFEGGKLKTGQGDTLPLSDGTIGNAGPGGLPSLSTELFTAGDIRSNEQVGLACVHTLFVREHNRLCDELAKAHPDWTDEAIYQRARKVVGALIQAITYHEFLPTMLGPYAPDPARAEYDPTLDPRIDNEFANAFYRVGHTMLSPNLMMAHVDETADEMMPLRDAFFTAPRVIEEHGIAPFLLGLASQEMQTVDNMIVDDVRNFLFGEPGQGGFDLASLNIQRGRDHGLPDYNATREAYGLARKASFDQITGNEALSARLADMYASVDEIDPWVGGLAEDPLPGSMFGELVTTVWADQFRRLRDGDRFWYANDAEFTDEDIEILEATRLSQIIRRNSNAAAIQDDAFHLESQQPVVESGGSRSNAAPAFCGTFGVGSLAALALGCGLMRLGGRRYRVSRAVSFPGLHG